MSELQFAKYEHLQLYRQWATVLCNSAINIANIEGGKIVHVHTHNRKLFKKVVKNKTFCKSAHNFQLKN